MADSAARLLELLSLLQGRDWTGSALATRLEVSPRTIRRDIDRLRDLGYPVEATMGAVGGYRLVGGTAMPPLLLDDEEAVAIAVGLRTLVAHAIEGGEDASIRALAKLQQVLPPRLRGRVAAVAAATGTLVWETDPIDPERLALLSRAIVNRERLRFEYVAADGSASRRTVEPHSVVAAGRRWYLVAWDADRNDWRTFRVDRIADPRSLPGHVAPRQLPAKDGAAWLRGSIEGSAPIAEAVALVEASARTVAARIRGAGTVESIDEQRCRVRLHADTIPWQAMRLLMLDAGFVVESPPELVGYLRALGGRVAQAVGGAGSAATARNSGLGHA
jgi:predicted DNA-binding transcriptional regulator YafY